MATDTWIKPLDTSVLQRSSGVADTECAHALLQLAMSPAGAQCHHGLTLTGRSLGQAESHGTKMPKSCALKRHHNNPFDVSAEAMDSVLLYQGELLKRIHLDHNYHCSGEEKQRSEVIMGLEQFRSYCEAIKQRSLVDGTDDADVNCMLPKYLKPDKENKCRKLDYSLGKYVSSYIDYGGIKSKSLVQPEKKLALKGTPMNARKHGLDVGDLYEFKDNDSEGSSPAEFGSQKKKHKSRSSEHASNDDRYRGFNLLLKCLSENDESSNQGSDTSRTSSVSSVHEDVSLYSSENSDSDGESSFHSPVMDKELPTSAQHQCNTCLRVFTKKRYLTKHVHRMHPNVAESNVYKNLLTMCPRCRGVVSKRELKRHQLTCDVELRTQGKSCEQDTATCQFCSQRMRHHLLVKHLAQEHCIEREVALDIRELVEAKNCESNGGEFEATLPLKTQDVAVCELCDVTLPTVEMKWHLAKRHSAKTTNKMASSNSHGTEMSKVQTNKMASSNNHGTEMSEVQTNKMESSNRRTTEMSKIQLVKRLIQRQFMSKPGKASLPPLSSSSPSLSSSSSSSKQSEEVQTECRSGSDSCENTASRMVKINLAPETHLNLKASHMRVETKTVN